MTRKHSTSVIGCALFSCLMCARSEAQPMVERIVAITESVGYEIDPAERAKYDLFAEYRGFLLAEVVSKGKHYWLRISYRRDKDRFVEQIALSDTELGELRDKIESQDAAIRAGARKDVSTEAEKEGRLRMVTDVFLYGLALYGPGMIVLIDIKGRAATGVELLVAGGSFAGALNATKDYRLGYGRTKLVRWGNYAGTFYGLGIPALFEVDSVRVYALSSMAMTPAGGYLAYRLSSQRSIGKGEADLISTGMWVGSLYGVAIPYAIDISNLSNSAEARVYLASAMAGVPAGAMVATRLVRDRPINRGRAHLITLGGFLGASAALTLIDLVDDGEHPRLYVGSAMVGLPVGALLGYRFSGDENYTLGRARMISVGAYAGGIVGNGLMYTLGADSDRTLKVSAMVGSAMGV